ncbi:hypothetical protein CVT25_006750 [Psilocybe cyanescens]|uniref:Uncharacterized protein n=1 Tax=Psilocybe cyanescens TaxID=93625 RepID=A0A409X7G5_PSICY|nr:hypothetical protein CVT25_006750 [Psilocybe cyanescens]
MVRLATSIVAATLLVVPALAATQQFERDVSESDLYTRSIVDDDIVVTREDLIDVFGRDVVVDLEEREPFGLGLLFKAVKTGVKLGKKAHEAHHHVQHISGNNNNNNNHRHRRAFDEEELSAREFVEDLEEREPFGLGLLL